MRRALRGGHYRKVTFEKRTVCKVLTASQGADGKEVRVLCQYRHGIAVLKKTGRKNQRPFVARNFFTVAACTCGHLADPSGPSTLRKELPGAAGSRSACGLVLKNPTGPAFRSLTTGQPIRERAWSPSCVSMKSGFQCNQRLQKSRSPKKIYELCGHPESAAQCAERFCCGAQGTTDLHVQPQRARAEFSSRSVPRRDELRVLGKSLGKRLARATASLPRGDWNHVFEVNTTKRCSAPEILHTNLPVFKSRHCMAIFIPTQPTSGFRYCRAGDPAPSISASFTNSSSSAIARLLYTATSTSQNIC